MTDVLMPALSPTMEEGTLAKWHVKVGDAVRRYRFGARTADFLVCRDCGAYVASVMEDFGVLNVVGADIAVLASRAARPVDYEGESADQRRARRRQRWTPTILEAA